VELGSATGQVSSIGLFYTTLLNFDNKKIYIPNSEVVSSNSINRTDAPLRRVNLNFEFSYEYPTERVREALLGAAAADGRVLSDPAPLVRLSAYKSSNIEYSLAVWAKNADYWDVYYGLNESVREHLAAAGLSISYDRVDVRIVDQ
jgi:small conductance mechanosensitive channel